MKQECSKCKGKTFAVDVVVTGTDYISFDTEGEWEVDDSRTWESAFDEAGQTRCLSCGHTEPYAKFWGDRIYSVPIPRVMTVP